MNAVPPPDPAELARGRALGERLDAITAEISSWMDRVDATDAARLERVQLYGGRVLASLLEARTDLGTLALAMAEAPCPG